MFTAIHIKRFQNLSKATMISLIAVGASCLLRIMAGLCLAAEVDSLSPEQEFDPEGLSARGYIYLFPTLSYAASSLISIVCFWIWFYRAYVYLEKVNDFPTERSTWWVFAGFIIPFISLVVPYRMMGEIWDRLEAVWFQHPEWAERDPLPANVLLFWWLSFLGSNFVSRGLGRIYGSGSSGDMSTASQYSGELWAEILSAGATAFAVIPAVLLVRNMCRLYTPVLEAMVRNAVGPAPPPPPPVHLQTLISAPPPANPS